MELDDVPILMGLAEGLPLGSPRGGTLAAAFDTLTADLLRWTYPGTPAFPDDERVVTRAELGKVLHYARLAAADPTRAVVVETADRRSVGRICNHLKLGEVAESKYALGVGNHWSSRLPQELRAKGYTEHFPVHVIRELLDQPQPRGYDREVQNLIIAVYALEQQLAWYHHQGRVELASVQQVTDAMELRRPPMPEESAWRTAVERARPLFGVPLPDWFTPAAVTEFAATMRTQAARLQPALVELVATLEAHASLLDLDPAARSGRLATARRVQRLLGALANERDDVVVVGLIEEAEVGEIDDKAASVAIMQAPKVVTALESAQWTLLDALGTWAATDPHAAVILDELRAAARADQHVQPLDEAIAVAVSAAVECVTHRTPRDAAPPERLGSGARTAEISDGAGLDRVVAEIRERVDGGTRVRVSWETLP